MKKFPLVLTLIFLTGCTGHSAESTAQTESGEPALFSNISLTAVCPDGSELYSADNGESWYSGSEESKAPELYLTLSEDGSDLFAVTATLHNNSEEPIHAASYYIVEILRDSNWVIAGPADLDTILMAHDYVVILSAGDSHDYRLNMEVYEQLDGRYRYYAELGEYRLSAEFDFDAAENEKTDNEEPPTAGGEERKPVFLA